MSNDYFKAQGWFKTYALNSQDSRGVFQELVKEDEEAFRLASAESDRIKAMMNEKYGPGTMKYGSEIKQPEIKTPQAAFEFSQRNPAAEGGRIPFGEAGFVDKANNVKLGQDLGKGITQRLRHGKIKYSVGSFGSKEKMKKKKIKFTEFTTLKEATDRRLMLVEKYGEPGGPQPDKIKFDYKKLVEQDPEFETFFKQEIKESKALQAVIKKYNLDENNLEEIWNKTRDETRRSEKIRKKSLPGEERLISPATFDKITKKFELTYKANKGTIDSIEMGKLLNLPEGELSKLMSHIDKPYPDSKISNTPLVSRIDKANTLKNILENEGIIYERTNRGGEKVDPDLGRYRFKVDENKFKELSESDTFGFEKKQPPVTQKMSDMYTGLSKASDNYQKFGYDKDSGTIRTLTKSLNNSLKAMNDKQLLKFIENNPKLNNLVTLEFNPKDPKMFKNQDLRKMDINIVRQNVNFEADHIRGKRTVVYDAATKKITDGLGLAYPKNLYIIPKGLNAGVKQRVENYVAENIKNPKMKKEIKLIDDYFKTNKISYWNRTTGKYGGHTPIETGTGLGQIGIEDKESLKKILTGKYVNTRGETKFIADNPDKLIESVNELNKSRVGMDYIDGKTDFIGVNSGFNTDLLMKDKTIQKILNSKAGQAVKNATRGTTAAAGKVFGGIDVVIGALDYANNKSKKQSDSVALGNAVQAMSINLLKTGDNARINEIKDLFVKNGGDGKIFDQATDLNAKDQEINDLIYNNKKTADRAFTNLSKTKLGLGESIDQRKTDYGILKKSLNEEIKNKIEERDGMVESYKTNLRVNEAGAPIQIGNQDFFSKPFRDIKRTALDKIESENKASFPMQKEQRKFTSGNIGNFIENELITLNPKKNRNEERLIKEMAENYPQELYRFNLERGMDPDNLIRVEDILDLKSKYPQLMGVNTTKYVKQADRKAEGGITGLRSKYEYKK